MEVLKYIAVYGKTIGAAVLIEAVDIGIGTGAPAYISPVKF